MCVSTIIFMSTFLQSQLIVVGIMAGVAAIYMLIHVLTHKQTKKVSYQDYFKKKQ